MTFAEIKEKLAAKKVGIAGCGGLGSNCAVSLARVGIGTLVIADYDRVEESNLNRQYFFRKQIGEYKAEALKKNIYKVNADVKVQEHVLKLGPGDILELYSDCDVIVEAFDRAEMKEMIIDTVQSSLPAIPLVCGVGMAGWGKNHLIETKSYGNLFIVGDGINEAGPDNPVMAPRVCAVSNMMANVVLEILLGEMK